MKNVTFRELNFREGRVGQQLFFFCLFVLFSGAHLHFNELGRGPSFRKVRQCRESLSRRITGMLPLLHLSLEDVSLFNTPGYHMWDNYRYKADSFSPLTSSQSPSAAERCRLVYQWHSLLRGTDTEVGRNTGV